MMAKDTLAPATVSVEFACRQIGISLSSGYRYLQAGTSPPVPTSAWASAS